MKQDREKNTLAYLKIGLVLGPIFGFILVAGFGLIVMGVLDQLQTWNFVQLVAAASGGALIGIPVGLIISAKAERLHEG